MTLSSTGPVELRTPEGVVLARVEACASGLRIRIEPAAQPFLMGFEGAGPGAPATVVTFALHTPEPEPAKP